MVDWHNYSDTILAMSLHKSHPLVKLTKQLEKIFGRTAFDAFCVTKAMKRDLCDNWRIEARVLYDRPPAKFKPISQAEKMDYFRKLSGKYEAFDNYNDNVGVIVSSTSWTEDEDFGILLKALVRYEEEIELNSDSSLPELLVVITGKGPQKQYYLEKISQMSLQHVTIVTPWLETEDYPTMLASADLGVCLHTSSSGLDLPMKVGVNHQF